ncbi:putative cysteine desulfurase [Candidatus Protochlamydia naegleriophila]|uniref:Putative cysteine desulfurase n=1 Tax=Candidatus Protochlamydia naegleriophila TaxID=389348 RepID=A0A0U5JAJ1_9BACT|nr:aminotransferase class V-fold PLP-dependent enzyme [Candidatus Protochlamydia naegleriophila]CUI15796.1 putative cysteine desulfurase [Candidatus Protochlamydia naegleriophila]
MTHSPIYLDNSTTSRPSAQAITQMMPYLTERWGLPSAPHQKGQELFPALKEYYKMLYSFLGAEEVDQFVLTSSGAEAVNQVVSSVYRDTTLPTGKNQFITSNADEAPALMAMSRLEPVGCVAKMIEVDSNGIVTAQALAEAISPRTALVSLSWANGLTGVVQPVADIAELCRQRGIRLHLDATHVLGKLFYELEEIKPDFITFNGDQLHAPKGTGGLYIRQGIKCSPFIAGGSDQAGLRAGGLNMAALAALAYASQEALECRDLICTETARLKYKLETGIVKAYPEAKICFKEQERLPHCTTLLFPGIASEALLYLLNRKGVYACIGGGSFQQLGLLLIASGMEENLAYSAISFSLSRYTTEAEIDRAIELIAESAHTLAKTSRRLFETKETL